MELLGLKSLIRMNRLVRGSIDASGFEAWWQEADEAERRALTRTLLFCAKEAGVKDTMVPSALQMSGLSGNEDGATQAVEATRNSTAAGVFYFWTPQAAGDSLHRAFRFGFFIFGLAEGEVFRGHTPKSCNHWWHRDLTNPRVVADLLNDPLYYSTSMETDQRLEPASSVADQRLEPASSVADQRLERRSWWQRLLGRR